MAPEQLEGGKITKAVDIYALGAVAFELLSGRKARQGRTPVEIAHQVATEPPPDIREAWPGAPPAAAEVLERAMARDPDDRPRSAGQLARSLDDAFKGTAAPDPASTQAMAVPFQRDERTRRTRAAAAAAPLPPRSRAVPPAQARSGVPRWIPVAVLVAALLVTAGAIAALTSGSDPTAPVVQTTKKPAAKKPGTKKDTTSTTQQSPTQSQTTPTQTAAAGGTPAQMQLQAHNLIAQGKYDDAIALDQQVVAAGPSTGLTYAYALYDLGHALRLAGRPAEAVPILEQRLKINNQRGVVKQELEQAKREAGSG
jgi:serine/threonine-protein kinase